ncbi:histidine kinase [Streptomyces sp. HPF1205]|uniref:sensor histidine kinase n=1 Tax=Streptomyces sp. HPF1205 TaxID=2873262 RepID=UPI001CECB9C7|nr:histidine kinase [Streptomyces sp. HPF1205]
MSRRELAGAVTVLACGVVSVGSASGTAATAVVAALVLAGELGMVLRRRVLPASAAVVPVAVAIGTGLVITVIAPQGLGLVPVLAGASVLPLHVPAGPVRNASIAVVAVAFGVTITVVSGDYSGLLAGTGAWFIADRTVEHEAVQVQRDRAVALLAEVEASRHALREAAAAEERNRIAGEMHDVLAHSLAGLSVQLQAIRAVAAREGAPPALTGPIDRAARLARDGVQEARAAVGALRASTPYDVDALRALVHAFPGDARLEVTGRPAPLGPEAAHAVYRAVQEAMTNAARYATGSAIEVRVAWDEQELRVGVRDNGLPAGGSPSGVEGGGTGLRSMAERIEAVRGELTAGPEPGGPGWRIELRVPVARRGAAGTTFPAGELERPERAGGKAEG